MTPTEIEPGDERKVLEALWKASGRSEFIYPDAANEDERARFDAMLDAGAYLDAAMMLVPEGWRVEQIGEHYDRPLRAKGPWFAIIYQPQMRLNDGGSGGGGDPFARCMNAPTPALALCAAIARAGD